METTHTARRIHPLMAAAAASVIIVSLAGAAAITGMLPTSHSATAPELSTLPPAPVALAAAPLPPAPAPLAVEQAPAPAVKHSAPRPRVVHHYSDVARNDAPNYQPPAVQAAPQPAQPNYLGIGAGAVIGGIIGNQVGGGNGKKLATVAGVIGGGILGNEVANRNK